MLEMIQDPQSWVALITLTALEIVLGIDNIVFIAILTDRLPEKKRPLAYRLGLGGAMITRVALLLTISWVMGLGARLFTVMGEDISGRDLILLAGGLFLIGKASHEIYRRWRGWTTSKSRARVSTPTWRGPSCRSCCWTSCSPWTR